MNYSGVEIPYYSGKTISGADKKWYFFRVKDLKHFLENKYGYADINHTDKTKFINKKRIICFDISYTDASGHFTLFDGKDTLGGEHDTEYYFNNASKIYLWLA